MTVQHLVCFCRVDLNAFKDVLQPLFWGIRLPGFFCEVKSPSLEAILQSKEQQKLLEKYGLDASFSELKDLISIWKDLESLRRKDGLEIYR